MLRNVTGVLGWGLWTYGLNSGRPAHMVMVFCIVLS